MGLNGIFYSLAYFLFKTISEKVFLCVQNQRNDYRKEKLYRIQGVEFSRQKSKGRKFSPLDTVW